MAGTLGKMQVERSFTMKTIERNCVMNVDTLRQKLTLAESVIEILLQDSDVLEAENKRLKRQIKAMKKASVN